MNDADADAGREGDEAKQRQLRWMNAAGIVQWN